MPSLVEIGSVILEKNFKARFTILLFPLEKKSVVLHLKTLNPLIGISQGCCVPSLVEIGSVVLEKKMKMLKVNSQTERQMDDGQKAIRKAHLSYRLRYKLKTCYFIS